MRNLGVTHVVVYDTNRSRLFGILDRLLTEPRQWPLVHLDGRVSVFEWHDPQKPNRAASYEELMADLDRLALQPLPDASPDKGENDDS